MISKEALETARNAWMKSYPPQVALARHLKVNPLDIAQLILYGQWPRAVFQEAAAGTLLGISPGVVFFRPSMESFVPGFLERAPDAHTPLFELVSLRKQRGDMLRILHVQGTRWEPYLPGCPVRIVMEGGNDLIMNLGISERRWAEMETWLACWLP